MLKLPDWVKKHMWYLDETMIPTENDLEKIREKIQMLHSGQPEVSIGIPAYNEEKNILMTLSSIADMKTDKSIEVIVVDNNSSDKTNEVSKSLGAVVYKEDRQGVSFARERALTEAKGKYFVCADSDTIYSPEWIDEIIKPLLDESVTCAYGSYSFIPPPGNTRFKYGLYELARGVLFFIKRNTKEYLMVRGANFAFRTKDGRDVGGFDLSSTWLEDGRMGLALSKIGKLRYVSSKNSVAWTVARRLMMEGSLAKAIGKRIKRALNLEQEER